MAKKIENPGVEGKKEGVAIDISGPNSSPKKPETLSAPSVEAKKDAATLTLDAVKNPKTK